MSRTYFDKAVECLPLAGIVELQKQNLLKSDLIPRASASALYSAAFIRFGVPKTPLTERAQLTALPYIQSADIKRAFDRFTPAGIADLEHTRTWSSTSGSTGKSKWIPYSDADLELFSQALMRSLYQMEGGNRHYRVLSLTSPAPFISDLLFNLAMMTHTDLGLRQEMISVGLSDVEPAIELARRRGVNGLIAFPSVAMKMAEEIESRMKSEAERRWVETRDPRWLAARLYLSARKPRARLMMRLKYGVFTGESLRPYREPLKRAFGMEPYETYALTEFPCLNIECGRHDGIHVWTDCCVPEVIPESELEKEQRAPGYIPRALFLDQAKPGTRGEYVVTTFSTALPLVRYRTSDIVEVVGTGPCACGRTHPRIRILYRSDDIINMGLIRFSVREVENALAGVGRHGIVRDWQIELKREGYKPAPRFIIAADRSADPQALTGEIRDALNGIEILKLGIDEGLILPPVIVLDSASIPATTGSGKKKRIVYAPNW